VRDTSRSNRVCVIQKPTVWIPSAFRPGNLAGNNTFKAVGLYEKLAINHVFSIFNRWGEQLFITSDPSEAWDGRYLSAIVPTGIYVYHLKFSLPDGTLFNERGSVMVLD
jgi:gliding motility-associated-like protein